MSVYVDPLMTCLTSKAWPRSCHMWADTEAELHAFAAGIGLRREWYQCKPKPTGHVFAHYDITAATRDKAVDAGAVEMDRKEAVESWRALGFTPRRNREAPR